MQRVQQAAGWSYGKKGGIPTLFQVACRPRWRRSRRRFSKERSFIKKPLVVVMVALFTLSMGELVVAEEKALAKKPLVGDEGSGRRK